MTLRLNSEVIALAYEYLRATEPFCFWNLPDHEDVSFIVSRDSRHQGQHCLINGRDAIEVSERYIGRTQSLLELVAHEMVHLHQKATKMNSNGVEHNAAFRSLALQVCKVHGFDSKLF